MDRLYMAPLSRAVSRILGNKKREQLGGGSVGMKAIVIFWILISLSFLEATLPGPGDLTRDEVLKTWLA